MHHAFPVRRLQRLAACTAMSRNSSSESGFRAIRARKDSPSRNSITIRYKIHLVAADARTAITFALAPGNAHEAPEGRAWLEALGPMPEGLPLLMDRA